MTPSQPKSGEMSDSKADSKAGLSVGRSSSEDLPPATPGHLRAQQERVRQSLRHDAFAKVGAELFLERLSNETALVRLHIGNLSFGIGQPRNGTEAASVLRTFRDALTDLLMAANGAPAWQPIATAPSDVCVLLYTPHLHATNPERIEVRVYHDTRAGSQHAWATHWMPLPPAPGESAGAQPSNEKAVDAFAALLASHQRLAEALTAIRDLAPRPYVMPSDWQEQIDACDECKRWRDHPIQNGICDTHRRPLWAREAHNAHEERAIGYRAMEAARAALASIPKETT